LNNVGSNGLLGKGLPGHQPENLSALTNDDLGFEGKAARELGAEPRLRDRLPDDEGAGRADVDGIEMFQLCGEL
jgi:hypothetical protein